MTTVIRTTIFVLLSIIVTTVKAQDFQGVATYKTQRKLKIKLDSTQMNNEMQTKMMEMMKKQFQKTFHLTFTKEESVYKEEESLDKPQLGGNGMVFQVMGNGAGDILYKNTKENRFTSKRDVFGKLFLVKDEISEIKWQLAKETKYIGKYPCFKATYTRMVDAPRSFSSADNDEDVNLDKAPEQIERVVTAWYTPQIPINNGPASYHGLPGLILEVHDGDLTVVCSKIVINPEEKIEINEPTKGKEVSQEKFETIMEKKSKEMIERYKPRKGDRNGGETFSITIGG